MHKFVKIKPQQIGKVNLVASDSLTEEPRISGRDHRLGQARRPVLPD